MNEAPLESLQVFPEKESLGAQALKELGRYNGGLQVEVVKRTNLPEQHGFMSDNREGQLSYHVADDCTLKEFGMLLQDMIANAQVKTTEPIFATRFRQESNALRVMLIDIRRTYGQSVSNESIRNFLAILDQFADLLQSIADTLSPTNTPQNDEETLLTTENLALKRLGTSEQAIHDRARKIVQLLERPTGAGTLDRYAAFIAARISKLLPELLKKTTIAESASLLAQTAYTFLPGKIAAPESYWVANPYAFSYGSPEQDRVMRYKDAFLGSGYDRALQFAKARTESGAIDLRIQQDLLTLRQALASDIQTIKDKRKAGTLTADEQKRFIEKTEKEIRKYGGWYTGSNLLGEIRDSQFGSATESSPSAAILSGQMHCTIRAALFGQLMMETDLSTKDVMSICTDIHTAIITKLPDGNYSYTSFHTSDGSPSSWTIPISAARIGNLLEPLSQVDVMPVKTADLILPSQTGSSRTANITTVHRGLTGVTCIAYSILATEYYRRGRQEENILLTDIVTTLDPYNPKFARRKEEAQRTRL